MIKRSSSARAALRHEINVTPFVDVMLVLLVIFMVATPMMQSGVPVDLPKGQPSQAAAPSGPALVISLDQEGGLFFKDKKVLLSQLIELLRALPHPATEPIYIRAHRTLPYENVMGVVSLLASKGFTKVVFVTEGVDS